MKTVAGNLQAQREAQMARFFGNKVAKAGAGCCNDTLMMSKPKLAQTDAVVVGTLPKGSNTVGGCVGGLTNG